MLPGLYQCRGLLNQVVDALIKMPKAFVLRLAAVESHIDLLQHNSQLTEDAHAMAEQLKAQVPLVEETRTYLKKLLAPANVPNS